MDLMNEAMKRRKSKGLEVVITVQEPGANGKAAQMAADKTSDLAPNPMDDTEPDPNDPNEAQEVKDGESPDDLMMSVAPARQGSLSSAAHDAMKAKMPKGKKT